MVAGRTALDEVAKNGAFVRTASTFRNWIKKGGDYPPEAGRYHLYVSYACPWAHRCLIFRSLYGLEDAISVSVVHPTFARTRPEDAEDPHVGWQFRTDADPPATNPIGNGLTPNDGATVDHIFGKKFIRDVYEEVGDTPNKKYSVPVLFDKKTKTIVNNESAEIIQMFGKEFDEIVKSSVDLFPVEKEAAMKEVDDVVYPGLNNGVYRCGFATTQAAYDEAIGELYKTLDWMEERLGKSRYLTGNELTASDIRAYVTLVRFDPVYVVHFKCSRKMVREYPNVYGYLRDIHQIEAVKKTTNMAHITRHYISSHTRLNHYNIIPQTTTDLEAPHDRATKFASA